ncbi:MAG: hypothetical protein BWY63_03434 [Chloroflexi bacterium ADurb.Bin360]|nr:MAG: hypothetical protein BWY63_03434 [Chloroflexi bacterium ADurb.Bin360]
MGARSRGDQAGEHGRLAFKTGEPLRGQVNLNALASHEGTYGRDFLAWYTPHVFRQYPLVICPLPRRIVIENLVPTNACFILVSINHPEYTSSVEGVLLSSV